MTFSCVSFHVAVSVSPTACFATIICETGLKELKYVLTTNPRGAFKLAMRSSGGKVMEGL